MNTITLNEVILNTNKLNINGDICIVNNVSYEPFIVQEREFTCTNGTLMVKSIN